MRKNYGAKPFSYPQPVFIIAAYDENGLPNAMNAAWGGISEMYLHQRRTQDHCEYPEAQSIYSKYGGSGASGCLRLRRYCFRQ